MIFKPEKYSEYFFETLTRKDFLGTSVVYD